MEPNSITRLEHETERLRSSHAEVMIANDDGVGTDLAALEMRPWDARVYRLA